MGEVRGWSPLRFAVLWNDFDVASVLLRRGAVIEPDALARAIFDRKPETVKFLLENGADVHAEIGWGGRPGETMPIHEYCAQDLQKFETGHERGWYSLKTLEEMREINKLVMDKKE